MREPTAGWCVFARVTGAVLTTLFAPPEISQDVAAEFAVLVQDECDGRGRAGCRGGDSLRASARCAPAADRSLVPSAAQHLAGGSGWHAERTSAGSTDPRAVRQQTAARCLAGLSRAPGEWRGIITVGRGEQALVSEFTVSVGVPTNRLLSVWPWLAMPPILIGIFVLNQRLRLRRSVEMGIAKPAQVQ